LNFKEILLNISPPFFFSILLTQRAEYDLSACRHAQAGKHRQRSPSFLMKVNSGDSFDFLKDLIYNLGSLLFEYNHLRRHGGLGVYNPL